MGKHDQSYTEDILREPGIAQDFENLFVQPEIKRRQEALRQAQLKLEAEALRLAKLKLDVDESFEPGAPLSVEPSGASSNVSTVSLQLSHPNNTSAGLRPPASTYSDPVVFAKEKPPYKTIHGMEGAVRNLLRDVDIRNVEIKPALRKAVGRRFREEAENAGVELVFEAGAVQPLLSRNAMVTCTAAENMASARAGDLNKVKLKIMKEFLVAYSKHIEDVAYTNMPGLLEDLANKVASERMLRSNAGQA